MKKKFWAWVQPWSWQPASTLVEGAQVGADQFHGLADFIGFFRSRHRSQAHGSAE
ncbi:MAG: hypothetical protein WDM70_11520 [Nitrosomonadales bacterium]